MVIGSDGVIFRTENASVLLGFDPKNHTFVIRSENGDVQTDLHLHGNLLNKEGKPVEGVLLDIISELQHRLEKLENIVLEVQDKVEQMYYAPNMPGYYEAESEFLKEVDLQVNGIVIDEHIGG